MPRPRHGPGAFREEVTTPQILSLEYFYFIAYLMITIVSVVVFVVTRPRPRPRRLTERDTLLPKLLHWPLSLAPCFAVTLWCFTERPAVPPIAAMLDDLDAVD